MKSLIKNFGILALTLICTVGATAQDDFQRSYFPPRDAGWWTLGINGGWAYQQSDVKATLEGYGFGMTLAKNMYYRPGGAISFDWRGRWLYSQSVGLDTKRSFGLENNTALNGSREAGEGLDYTQAPAEGYVFQNHKTQQFELGLEGVLTANRLRERTGIIASIYGGVNLDWYNTKLDQSNNNGIYDYSKIDENDSQTSIKKELRNNILDKNYETNAHGNEDGAGKIKLMPSLGVELGYQFTPRFSMHVGHKATFARTDDLDGQLWDNNNNVTADNDIHHYTNIGLRWIIDPREHRMEPPIINVTRPGTNPYVSKISQGRVEAKIKNVNSKADVTCSVNGYPTSFSFNRGRLNVSFPLEYGNNEIVITASNEVGTDEETVVIYYGDNSPPPPPVVNNSYAPRVKITSPNQSPYNTDNSTFDIRANIEYINSKNDVEFLVNGRNVSNFNYSSRNNQFSGDIRLSNGRNEIEIIARNEVGSDRDNVVIFYERKTARPRVNITTPARSPYETTQRNITVRADLQNVNSKNDVRYFVNGRERSNFDYNSRTGRFVADLNLVDGRNTVLVKGYNEAGNDEDEAIIIYKINTPTVQPPRVTITSPSQSTYETSQNSITIRADLKNVDSKNDVRFFLNGRTQSRFDFNARTGKFSATVNLSRGANEVTVKGYNEAGDDEDKATIYYKDNTPTVQPPVVTITSVSSGTANPFEPNASACRTTINATITNVERKSDITFRVNGRNRTDFSFNANSKVFTSTLTLDDGRNDFVIRAVNTAGSDEDTASKNCENAPTPKNPPQVTINNPSNNSTSTEATVNLNARIKYVKRKQDVRVKLNGTTISNFSFSPVSSVVTARLNLKNGSNTISVWGKNTDGTDEESVRVRYNAPTPKNPPTVNITQPSNNAKTDTKTAVVKAKVMNVSGKNDIRFTFNGRNNSNFSYSTSSKILTANVELKNGSNTIIIKATTADGSDSETVRVTYEAPKVLPTVKINTPKNNSTTENKKAPVKATIKNVTNKNDVTFLVNGKKITTFNLRRSKLTSTISLKEGRNTIRVKVKNIDGTAQDEVSVTYRPKVVITKPSVKFTNPTRPGSTVKKSNVTAKATIQNVTNKKQITVKVNGKSSSFNFDSRRKIVSIPLTLKKGTTKIVIQATNDGGATSAESSFVYNPRVAINVQKPTIKITSVSTPTANPFNPTVSGSTIIAMIGNINDKSQIKVTQNGSPISDFTFNSRTRKFEVKISLAASAENKVKITATNRSGSTVKEHTY